MTEIQLYELNEMQREQYRKELDDKTGCGIIYNGNHYQVYYEPSREKDTLKCMGIDIIVRNIIPLKGSTYREVHTRKVVYFKNSWFNKTPFTKRLEETVERMKKFVVNREIEDKRVQLAVEEARLKKEELIMEQAKKIKSCQLKMDATIKKIEPEAKSLASIPEKSLLDKSVDENYWEKEGYVNINKKFGI